MHTLHQDNESKGFTVLAFPCNQFGAQEPGSNEEILEFAKSKYNVDFPMFAKIDVNGDAACDLYKFLKSQKQEEDGNEDIPWNFSKFLVDGSGNVVERFPPTATKEEIGEALTKYL